MNAVEFDGTNTRTPSTLVVFWCPGTAILGVAIIGGAVASEKIDENHESHDTWRASWRASGTPGHCNTRNATPTPAFYARLKPMGGQSAIKGMG